MGVTVPRLHVAAGLQPGDEVPLPEGAARHAQVRRVQPGDPLLLFDGSGAEWPATVLRVGRSEVVVRVGEPAMGTGRELPFAVTLALGMPANERMDVLVEKATELGVAAIQPLHCERSVLRLQADRAARRQAHWQAVAVAACEQCGRAVVPRVAPVADLEAFVDAARAGPPGERWVLSLAAGSRAPHAPEPGPAASSSPAAPAVSITVLSGPEGGLSPREEGHALAAGYVAIGLGPRVLRADTAPLALLAWLGLQSLSR